MALLNPHAFGLDAAHQGLNLIRVKSFIHGRVARQIAEYDLAAFASATTSPIPEYPPQQRNQKPIPLPPNRQSPQNPLPGAFSYPHCVSQKFCNHRGQPLLVVCPRLSCWHFGHSTLRPLRDCWVGWAYVGIYQSGISDSTTAYQRMIAYRFRESRLIDVAGLYGSRCPLS